MLTLRPNCECCDKDLPPDAADAMICSYECTFCRDCMDQRLENVCPNCGGGFAKRPTTGLDQHPPSEARVSMKHSGEALRVFIDRIKETAPEER